ncbi:mitochondrial import inner membrane translocase subunit tim54 [Malassezia sp. CBS 17886]|nr:mitochondrial import inner membrane translocase subunit tim54 [Malassezia sp. CBS 17886]
MMSDAKSSAAATPLKREVPSALRPLKWMGIPESVLTMKPRLPSRNWSIFLASVAAVTFLYYEDRRQCQKIREGFKERVRGLAEVPMNPTELPRKVLVYTAKYPGDDDYEVAVDHFKRFVKPILVAAAVDYEIVSGTRYGGLARELRDRIHERRRNLAGVLPWPTAAAPDAPVLPFALAPAEQLQRELDGAVVLMGRPAFKEWAWALKEGWGTSIPVSPVDRDEELAARLSDDNTFDEELPAQNTIGTDEEMDAAPAPSGFQLPTQVGLQSMQKNAPLGAPLGTLAKPSTGDGAPTDAASTPQEQLPPVAPIPAQPPIGFVDFTNMVGWRNIPRRMAHFFNHREDVRSGGEAALRIVFGDKADARAINVPPPPVRMEPPQGGDLDFGLKEESFYPKRFLSTLQDVEKARGYYYNQLGDDLKASREIARGEREPTKAETREPPKSEVELRDERFNKEKRWRDTEMGFEIVRPEVCVAWDEAWRNSLRVLRDRDDDERAQRRTAEASEQEDATK